MVPKASSENLFGSRSEWSSAIDLALRILAASRQPMLARQLAQKLERYAMVVSTTWLDSELQAASSDEPRLQRDEHGRWRFASNPIV